MVDIDVVEALNGCTEKAGDAVWSEEESDDDGGGGGDVSTNEEYAGSETLTVPRLRLREMRVPKSNKSIWQQMENMTISEESINTQGLERKRQREGEDDDMCRRVKKWRTADELLGDMLAELSGPVDWKGGTYLGNWAAQEIDEGWKEGWKEEDEELLVSLLS